MKIQGGVTSHFWDILFQLLTKTYHPRLENVCHLHCIVSEKSIKRTVGWKISIPTVMILTTVIVHCWHIKLGSLIYPASIGHFFPLRWAILCRKPLLEIQQNWMKQWARFPYFFFLAIWMCLCILSIWENWMPMNKCFTHNLHNSFIKIFQLHCFIWMRMIIFWPTEL